jgi:hypothetical protein
MCSAWTSTKYLAILYMNVALALALRCSSDSHRCKYVNSVFNCIYDLLLAVQKGNARKVNTQYRVFSWREEEEVDDARRPSCEVAVYMVFGAVKNGINVFTSGIALVGWWTLTLPGTSQWCWLDVESVVWYSRWWWYARRKNIDIHPCEVAVYMVFGA